MGGCRVERPLANMPECPGVKTDLTVRPWSRTVYPLAMTSCPAGLKGRTEAKLLGSMH